MSLVTRHGKHFDRTPTPQNGFEHPRGGSPASAVTVTKLSPEEIEREFQRLGVKPHAERANQ